MRLKYLPDAENPIISTQDFLQRRKELYDKNLAIMEYSEQRKKALYDKYHSITEHSDQSIKDLSNAEYRLFSKEMFQRRDELSEWGRKAFFNNMPSILISQCPFCERELWMPTGPMFSLTDNFWFRAYSDGRGDIVDKGAVCEHLFCIDGALHLNGHTPVEARPWHSSSTGKDWDYIWLASEVPFLKPRVMGLPGMVAVMTDFPIDKKYTAYPIVYFAQEALYPHYREDFCIPWATKVYVDNHGSGYFLNGKREDAQVYDLSTWLDQGKLYWLETHPDRHQLIQGTRETFPYLHLSGRQHPYKIVEGKVIDLPKRNYSTQAQITYSE